MYKHVSYLVVLVMSPMMETNEQISSCNNTAGSDDIIRESTLTTASFQQAGTEEKQNHETNRNKQQQQQQQQQVSSSNNSFNSPKMGSRRIFTPQFKLQVLESYRNDSDCKGNQRATARKYNIHRRQIQKWLQCEPSLRSSVANINQSSIKHQFHNISMPQQTHQHQHQSELQKYTIPANSTNVTISDSICRYNPQYSASSIVVEAAAQPVCKSIESTLAVVVAAVAGAAEAMTIGTSISTTTSPSTVVSPLRPTAIVGGSSVNATTSTTLHTQQHHHPHPHPHQHYRIPSYTHLTSALPITVPILAHHTNHHHHHNAQHQQTIVPYQYQGHTSFTHHIKQQLLAVATREQTPDESSSITSSIATTYPMIMAKAGNTQTCTLSQTDADYVPKYTTKFHHNNNRNSVDELATTSTLPLHPYKSTNKHNCHQPAGFLFQCPIDLSLGGRRETKTESNITPQYHGIYMNSSVNGNATSMSDVATRSEAESVENSIVDLTFRKRKVMSMSEYNFYGRDNTFYADRPEKQTKHSEGGNEGKIKNDIDDEGDVEVEIDIVEEEKKVLPSKPIKLFKPYLLDDEKYNCNSTNESGKKEPTALIYDVTNSQRFDSNDACKDINAGHNFQLHTHESFIRSPNFLSTTIKRNTTSPVSAFSPTISVPTLSPTSLQCSKGSPLSSGYESSSSTYSECSSSRSEPSSSSHFVPGQSYSLNVQMHKIYNDNIMGSQSNHIQRWLDQDSSNQSATTSIALYA